MNTLDLADVDAAVRGVVDPELGGLTIGDLGLVFTVDEGPSGGVVVTLLPTFLGCPALALIASDVVTAATNAGAPTCLVTWSPDPRWSPERISSFGITHLGSIGIAVATQSAPDPACPACGGGLLQPISPVGSTACRSVAWCGGCRSVIDVLGSDRSCHAHV